MNTQLQKYYKTYDILNKDQYLKVFNTCRIMKISSLSI